MSILLSTNVETSVDFYEQGLEFFCSGKWKNDDGVTGFAIIQLDDITLGLQCVDVVPIRKR